MSFKDFFEGHVVKTTITEIKNLLSVIIEKYPDTKNLDEIIKIDNSIQYITGAISTANHFVSPRSSLDNIDSQLQKVKHYLAQYQANRSNQLINAILQLEEAIVFAEQIIQNSSSQKNIVIITPKEIIEKLAQTSEETIFTLQSKTSEFDQKSNEFISKLKVAENNFNTVQQRVDVFLASLQTSYNAEEKIRKDSFEKDIQLFELKFKDIVKDIVETNKNSEVDIQNKAKILLNELEQIKKKAGEILQIVSNTGFAGNYSKNADAEKKNANILRGVSIGIFFILALYMFFTFQQFDISWQGALVRILIALLPSTLAAYLARESGKHRKFERFYRNMELELSALDAFIENVPEKERNDLKIEITRKLFSDDKFIHEIDSKNEEESKAVFSIPKSIAQIFAEILKSVVKK